MAEAEQPKEKPTAETPKGEGKEQPEVPKAPEVLPEAEKAKEKVKEKAKEARREVMGMVLNKWMELTKQVPIRTEKGLIYGNAGDRIRVIDTKGQTVEGEPGYYKVEYKFFNTLTGRWKVENGLMKLPIGVKPLEVLEEEKREEKRKETKTFIDELVEDTANVYAKAVMEAEKVSPVDPDYKAKKNTPYEILNRFMDQISPEMYGATARAAYPLSTPYLLRRVKRRSKAIRNKLEEKPLLKAQKRGREEEEAKERREKEEKKKRS